MAYGDQPQMQVYAPQQGARTRQQQPAPPGLTSDMSQRMQQQSTMRDTRSPEQMRADNMAEQERSKASMTPEQWQAHNSVQPVQMGQIFEPITQPQRGQPQGPFSVGSQTGFQGPGMGAQQFSTGGFSGYLQNQRYTPQGQVQPQAQTYTPEQLSTQFQSQYGRAPSQQDIQRFQSASGYSGQGAISEQQRQQGMQALSGFMQQEGNLGAAYLPQLGAQPQGPQSF